MIGRLTASAPYWVTLAVSGYLYYAARGIGVLDTGDQLGPDFWPKAALILMMLVCVYAIGRIMIFGPRRGGGDLDALIEGAPAAAEDATPAQSEERFPLLLVGGIALVVLYVVLFNVLGFFLDTFLLLLGFMLIGRYRRYGVAFAVSLVGTLVFMFVFMKIVYVPLPLGTAPFSEVSILLMKLMGIR